MLSSSHAKIHNPCVTGVSPRPTDRLRRQKLRNTSEPVGAENPVTLCDLHVFVDEATESISPERPDGRSGTWWCVARGRALIE